MCVIHKIQSASFRTNKMYIAECVLNRTENCDQFSTRGIVHLKEKTKTVHFLRIRRFSKRMFPKKNENDRYN